MAPTAATHTITTRNCRTTPHLRSSGRSTDRDPGGRASSLVPCSIRLASRPSLAASIAVDKLQTFDAESSVLHLRRARPPLPPQPHGFEGLGLIVEVVESGERAVVAERPHHAVPSLDRYAASGTDGPL